jgi:hypothetical protein
MVLLCHSPVSQERTRHQFSRVGIWRGITMLAQMRGKMWRNHWEQEEKGCGVCSHSSTAGTISSMLVPDLHLQRHIKLSLTLCLLQWKPTSSTLIHIQLIFPPYSVWIGCLLDLWTVEFAQTMVSSIRAKDIVIMCVNRLFHWLNGFCKDDYIISKMNFLLLVACFTLVPDANNWSTAEKLFFVLNYRHL